MASFYYYDQNSFGFTFIFKFGSPSEVQIFAQESKTLKDRGHSSKMTPSCKWSIVTQFSGVPERKPGEDG